MPVQLEETVSDTERRNEDFGADAWGRSTRINLSERKEEETKEKQDERDI